MNQVAYSAKKQSRFDRFIDGIERVGNALPHPFWLFVGLSTLLVILSMILSWLHVELAYQAADRGGQGLVATTVAVQNLLSRENIQDLLVNFTSIYSGFAPLGLVMIMILGLGLLEQTGMLSALIRKTILSAPVSMLIIIVALVGINANLASDAGVVIVPAIAGSVFQAMGLNPWIGVITGYVAASGGFTANFIIAGTDVLLAGISESVVKDAHINATVSPLINWYFMFVGTFVVTLAVWLVTKFYIGPKLEHENIDPEAVEADKHRLTPDETRGLRACGIAAIVFIAVVIALIIPANSVFKNDEHSLLPRSPFTQGIVAILFSFFFVQALVFAMSAKRISSLDEVPKMMQKGLIHSLQFIVIALPASIFLHLFHASKIDTVLGVALGGWLENIQPSKFGLILIFLLLSTTINLVMTSNSAKWLILAPVFLPVFARLGVSPALVQVAYRIGDTATNIISPIDYYVPVIMGLLANFNLDENRKVGIGTVISLCLPYSIAFWIGLTLLLFVWYLLGLPLGPGAPLFI